MSGFMRVEDLKVYQMLCQLHIDVCRLSERWPSSERFELIHLFIANLKDNISESDLEHFRERYSECVRMLNGLERTLERQLPPESHRWSARPPEP